ncbi:MAG: glycosyltransferase [Allomuricauda sp.]|nr:MAG: glycosyltransferase [Allomuricauda sp.]
MNRVLVIGHHWPEPSTTAAGQHMMQLISSFQARHYHVTFASTAARTEHSVGLKDMGIEEVTVRLNHDSFDEFIVNLAPHIVVFDRFMVEEQFGWRVAEQCPGALRVLNTEDLHSLREFRGKCIKKPVPFTTEGWLNEDKTKRELASIYRSDLSLLVSTFEKQLLQDVVGIKAHFLLHIPFLLDAMEASKQKQWPVFAERKDFITYGNGKHAPNVDSIEFLKEHIWPLIKTAVPEAQLHIYGAYLPQGVHEMQDSKKGFLVHGWIDDLESAIKNARVVLAPLRFGAGIKGKLTLAMQCGTPSVTTDLGTEGMITNAQWPGTVANTSNSFAEAAIQLYNNEVEWTKAQNQGFKIINTDYVKSNIESRLFTTLEKLSANLETHRNNNIVGGLLQHQSLAATKFMGKWIEEKNKRD